jgi:CubicO group peptidase (beta-lactamase class C family)
MATRVFGPLILTLLVGSTAFGQAPPQSLDAIFKDFTSDQSPGCAVGATRGDPPLAAKAYGMADLEHAVRLTPQSVFYMASVSKQFAALSILLLERDAKLQLDDRVKTHIPELPSYADAITIRQLLHHTSGLRDYLTLSSLAGHSSDYVITDRGALQMLARQAQLNFAAGTEHLYSNSGYILLSLIVQRVTGRPLDDFARERIFTPLNMRSTRFQHDHAALIPDRAIGYVKRNDAWRISNSLLDVVGDGGMYSSVDDMLRWAAAFERPEFAPLLSRMATPGTLAGGRPIASGYGMGLAQGTYRGLPTVAHGGALAGYRTMFLRVPAEKLTVVTLCNNATVNAARLAQMVAELYAGDRMSAAVPGAGSAPPVAPALPPVPRELGHAMVGTYYSEELEATYRIATGSEGVTLEIGSNAPVVLGLIGSDRLSARPGAPLLTPVRDGAGRITGFTLTAGRVRDIAFTRR